MQYLWAQGIYADRRGDSAGAARFFSACRRLCQGRAFASPLKSFQISTEKDDHSTPWGGFAHLGFAAIRSCICVVEALHVVSVWTLVCSQKKYIRQAVKRLRVEVQEASWRTEQCRLAMMTEG